MDYQEQLATATPAFVDFECTMPSMQALILDYLATHAQVTFIDLEDDVPGFSGDLTLRSLSNRNTVLWRGLSRAAVHALCELTRQEKIEFTETSFRIYRNKGRRLQLPIAKWGSQALHWTPVFVRLSAEAESTGQKGQKSLS